MIDQFIYKLVNNRQVINGPIKFAEILIFVIKYKMVRTFFKFFLSKGFLFIFKNKFD